MTSPLVVPFLAVPGPPGPGSLIAMSDATPAGGIVQAVNSAWVPCDVRTGSVTVNTPLAPSEGWLFAVSDIWALSTVSPIIVLAQGAGITIANPSYSGVGSLYGTQAFVAQQGAIQMWRYSAATLQWRLT